ncbi:MAG TPA: hypothetical protein VJ859_04650 [Allosphingosinicella sp.]|nr:hypothetical protein [Allosphingosinicella sp.]
MTEKQVRPKPNVPSLPRGFEELAPFVEEWSLAHEVDRARKRWDSPVEESRRFYDAMLPRLDEALVYLDGFDLNALPPPETRLLFLAFSLAEIANTIEVYQQPGVPNAFSAERYRPTIFPDRI